MLKRLLKLMSGLIPFWGKRKDSAACGPHACDDLNLPELNGLLDRVGKALAPDRVDESCPTESDYSSALDFMIARHEWEWPGSPKARGAMAELKRLRYFRVIGEMMHREDASHALDQIIDRHVWGADMRKAREELRLLKEGSLPGRADYRACDTCNAFLTAHESSNSTCRRCGDARMAKYCRGPIKAEVAAGGVDISFPAPFPTATPFGTEPPRITVRLGVAQAMACARTLVEPGSDGMGIRFDGNSMLIVGWRDGDIELVVRRIGLGDKTLTISAAQAARLGKDIGGCLGIDSADAPACDHEFTDARNEVVASGEVCMKCGAIRAGNGEDGRRAPGTPGAFLEFIRKSKFDRSKLHAWERDILASYLRIPRASSVRPADAPACDHKFTRSLCPGTTPGEVRLKCGAIRAGNGEDGRRAPGTPGAFLEFIRKSKFDRSKLRTWEREILASYLRIPRASGARPADATACDHDLADASDGHVADSPPSARRVEETPPVRLHRGRDRAKGFMKSVEDLLFGYALVFFRFMKSIEDLLLGYALVFFVGCLVVIPITSIVVLALASFGYFD